MYFRKTSWFVGTLVSALALGCSSQKNGTSKNVDPSYSEVKQSELESERKEFIKDRQEEVTELNTEISRLDARLKHEGQFVDAEQKAEWSQDLYEAQEKHRKAEDDMKRAQNATPEEWAEMRGGFDSAVDSVQAGATEAGSEIGQVFSGDEDDDADEPVTKSVTGVELCTVQVDGTTASVADRGDQVIVTMTTTDDANLAELRERAQRMAQQATGAGSGKDPVKDAEVENISNGVRVVFDPAEGQQAALRQQLEKDAERIRNNECT